MNRRIAVGRAPGTFDIVDDIGQLVATFCEERDAVAFVSISDLDSDVANLRTQLRKLEDDLEESSSGAAERYAAELDRLMDGLGLPDTRDTTARARVMARIRLLAARCIGSPS